eukprot:jgi/Chrzof1/5714/Cz16g12230.t1
MAYFEQTATNKKSKAQGTAARTKKRGLQKVTARAKAQQKQQTSAETGKQDAAAGDDDDKDVDKPQLAKQKTRQAAEVKPYQATESAVPQRQSKRQAAHSDHSKQEGDTKAPSHDMAMRFM